MSHPCSSEDPFSSLLTLEDTLYTTAYDLGAQAGAHAGRIEGRIFGLEKGLEKFAMMGELHGRACVWGARVPRPLVTPKVEGSEKARGEDGEEAGCVIAVEKEEDGPERIVGQGTAKYQRKETHTTTHEPAVLPQLPPTTRLTTHISLLHGLTDPLTFSTLNEEEAVADYDDRLKRASAKTKMIERIVGEKDGVVANGGEEEKGAGNRSENGNGKGRGGKGGMKVAREKKEEGNIEDFAGSRLLA